MRSLLQWFVLRMRPDRRSLSQLADFLVKRKKASGWWDHSHLTRRLATRHDAEEYKELPAEKRYVLLQAARFSSHYYVVATFPVLALAIAILVPTILKSADEAGIPIELQVSIVTGIAVFAI